MAGSEGEPFLNLGVIIAVLHSSGMECVSMRVYEKGRRAGMRERMRRDDKKLEGVHQGQPRLSFFNLFSVRKIISGEILMSDMQSSFGMRGEMVGLIRRHV